MYVLVLSTSTLIPILMSGKAKSKNWKMLTRAPDILSMSACWVVSMIDSTTVQCSSYKTYEWLAS